MVRAAPRPQDLHAEAEAEDLRCIVNQFRTALGRNFVQKQEIIDLMTVAAIAPEPVSPSWTRSSSRTART
jgi:MoxR-like ATPase